MLVTAIVIMDGRTPPALPDALGEGPIVVERHAGHVALRSDWQYVPVRIVR